MKMGHLPPNFVPLMTAPEFHVDLFKIKEQSQHQGRKMYPGIRIKNMCQKDKTREEIFAYFTENEYLCYR